MAMELRYDADKREHRWYSSKGNPIQKSVSGLSIVRFWKFPVPCGPGGGAITSVRIDRGSPVTDLRIIVGAYGNSWGGTYLLSRAPREVVKLERDDEPFIDDLLAAPEGGSLTEFLGARRAEARAKVDVEALALKRGLEVFYSAGSARFWLSDVGQFDLEPTGWTLLRKGDAKLTREVRKGIHWIMKQREHGHSVEVGTLAPESVIQDSFLRLGGLVGATARADKKRLQMDRRQLHFRKRFEDAIRRCFPGIPSSAISDVVAIASSPGCVGNADWLWFAPREHSDARFDEAAILAVRAYIRHNHTDYDQIIDVVGREDARREIVGDVDRKAREWSAKPELLET